MSRRTLVQVRSLDRNARAEALASLDLLAATLSPTALLVLAYEQTLREAEAEVRRLTQTANHIIHALGCKDADKYLLEAVSLAKELY